MIVLDVAKVRRRYHNKIYYQKNRERRKIQYRDKTANLPPPIKLKKQYLIYDTGKFIITFD